MKKIMPDKLVNYIKDYEPNLINYSFTFLSSVDLSIAYYHPQDLNKSALWAFSGVIAEFMSFLKYNNLNK